MLTHVYQRIRYTIYEESEEEEMKERKYHQTIVGPPPETSTCLGNVGIIPYILNRLRNSWASGRHGNVLLGFAVNALDIRNSILKRG